MKKVFLSMGWCIFAIAILSICSIDNANAKGWSDGSMTIVSTSEILDSDSQTTYACAGFEQQIKVKTYGQKDNACVYGHSNQFRFARFLEAGIYKYAISHPRQADFYEIRGVCAKPSCAYSPDSDVFIEHKPIENNNYGAVIHKNFSKKMLRQIEPTTLKQYYLLNTDDEFGMSVGYAGAQLQAGAISFSNNGKWAAIELPHYGIIRVDTNSMNIRRVAAQGAEYGFMGDSNFELAVTNDGNYIATTGYVYSTDMYAINETCGDTLDASTRSYFGPTVTSCKSMADEFNGLFPEMLLGNNLKFTDDGGKLGVSVRNTNGKKNRVILAPTALHTPAGYIALGDSFTSGEGESGDSYYKEGTNEEKLKCHVSVRSYPFLVASRWGVRGNSVACSGARTVDVYGKSGYAGQSGVLEGLADIQKSTLTKQSLDSFRPGVVRQSQFVSVYQPDLVSIGIGGNDAGLVGKLSGCLSPGDCEWVSSKEKIAATAKEISEVYPKIRELIRHLRQSSPGTKFFTVGYPKIINANVDASCDLVTKTLLSYKERVFIDKSLSYLNDIIEAASSAEKVRFVDVEHSFLGHNLCGQDDASMMNGVRMGDDIALPVKAVDFRVFGSESYHPTPKGHAAVADAIIATFSSKDKVSDCLNCTGMNSLPETPEYWDVSDSAYIARQFEDTSIAASVYELGSKIFIQTDPMLFMGNAEVVVELRSDPKVLARKAANMDGSFTFEGTILPDTPPGYHTLHLLGTAPDDTPVDIYRTIAVNSKDAPITDVVVNTIKTPPVSILNDSPASNGSGPYTSAAAVIAIQELGSKKSFSVLGLKTDATKSEMVTTQDKDMSVGPWALIGILGATLVIATCIYLGIRKKHARDPRLRV